MPNHPKPDPTLDWELATWDGARREALRRWAQLPLECVIAALEEMQELSDMLANSDAGATEGSLPTAQDSMREQQKNQDSR